MIHIQRFLDKLAGVEGRHGREVVLTMPEARGLHSDITRLLAQITDAPAPTSVPEKIEISVNGGTFKD